MYRQNKVKYIASLLVILNCLSAKAAVTNLVEPVKFFTNHDLQFNMVSNQLLTYNQVGIVGISGIGKTQLARMYAYKHKEQYDIIWFFDCKTDLAEQFLTLARAVNSDICKDSSCRLSEEINTAQKSVVGYLTSQKNWLLVFDNLAVNQNIKIMELINWEHNGHIILCSQDTKGLPKPVKMTAFNLKDSIELLIKLMRDAKLETMDELAKAFKGSPVLTVQAALFLKENKYVSVEEYKNIIAKSDNKVKTHIELVIKHLSDTSRDLLNKAALLNNQKLSKNIIEHITTNKSHLTENLYSLSRFGLIETINQKELEFEMHDTVKDAVLAISNFETNKENVNQLLDSFNRITPPDQDGSVHRYAIMSKDTAIISNYELLIKNAEKYNANLYKIMRLRKDMLYFYILNNDYYNYKRMINWLKEQEDKKTFNLLLMNNDERASYCWYLGLVSRYGDTKDNLYYTNKAKEVSYTVKDYPRIKASIYDNIAMTEISRGNLVEAEKVIPIIEKINAENVGRVNANRILWIKSRMFLAQGNYKEALDFINRFLEAEQELRKSIAISLYYTIKAEILNNMENFQDAYQIMTELYKKEHDRNTNEYLIARILTQLAKSELGLNKIEEAKNHASLAEKILLTKPENINTPQDSTDADLAGILVTRGDILAITDDFTGAIECYETAEKIYRNVYKTNFGNLDNVSYLLLQGVKSSVKLNNKFWYRHFAGTLKRLFPIEHHRVKELLNYQLPES